MSSFQEPGATAPCVACGKDTAENAQDERSGLFYPACWVCQSAARAKASPAQAGEAHGPAVPECEGHQQ